MSSIPPSSPSHATALQHHIVCLPVEIINKIKKIEMSKIKTNHSLVFLDLLLNVVISNKKQVTEYSNLGSKYLRKVFNSRYREWLKILLEQGIVECDGEWIKFLGISLGYRINPKLISNWDDIEVLKIITKSGYSPTEEDLRYQLGLFDFYDSISIDYERLHQITAKIIQGKDEEAQFKRFAWIRAIRLLENKFLIAKRSSTNNRLNTNFTILPNPLFSEIKKSNNLMEIDAVNSQFAILANMIKDKVDDGFVQDAINGLLYEKVADKLGCDRSKAKTAMLKLVYSKAIYTNKQKTLIKELYPESIALFDKYKTKSSNRELAIRMQKKEAELYVDGILDKLYNLGIRAISKHDSIIFHREDKEIVQKVMTEVLQQSQFDLKIKIH